MYVSSIHLYPKARYDATFDLDVIEGTERVDLFFDGQQDETLSQLQTPDLFFYPDARKAGQAYRARIARLDRPTGKLPSQSRVALRRTSGISRNVVILWARPDVPQRLRSIVQGCLRA